MRGRGTELCLIMSALPGVVTKCYRSQFGEPGFHLPAMFHHDSLGCYGKKLCSHTGCSQRTSLIMSVLPGVVSRCFRQRSVKPVWRQSNQPSTTHLPTQSLLIPTFLSKPLLNQLFKPELPLPPLSWGGERALQRLLEMQFLGLS